MSRELQRASSVPGPFIQYPTDGNPPSCVGLGTWAVAKGSRSSCRRRAASGATFGYPAQPRRRRRIHRRAILRWTPFPAASSSIASASLALQRPTRRRSPSLRLQFCGISTSTLQNPLDVWVPHAVASSDAGIVVQLISVDDGVWTQSKTLRRCRSWNLCRPATLR